MCSERDENVLGLGPNQDWQPRSKRVKRVLRTAVEFFELITETRRRNHPACDTSNLRSQHSLAQCFHVRRMNRISDTDFPVATPETRFGSRVVRVPKITFATCQIDLGLVKNDRVQECNSMRLRPRFGDGLM